MALLVKVPRDAEGAENVEDTSVSLYRASSDGFNAEPITVGSVVDDIKQVWYDAVIVVESGSSLRSFGGTFSKSVTKC